MKLSAFKNTNPPMSLTLEETYKALQEQFYVNVPFSLESTVLVDAVQAFFKFLEEPESVKNYIDFTIAPEHRRGDVGYKHRDPNDHLYNDSKDFFHFHPALFEEHGTFLDQNPVVRDFMTKAYPIWNEVYQTMSDILRFFEQDFPGVHDKVFDTKYPHILLRFLRYEWQESGKYLAKPHYDAGAFTLAITESCPGLRIGSQPENLTPVNHEAGNATFMLSSNFQKVMNTEKLSAGWHDVIQLDDRLIGKPFARWAIVAFIDAHGVEALPRSETHKWFTGEEG